jgi:hypothetical protein
MWIAMGFNPWMYRMSVNAPRNNQNQGKKLFGAEMVKS